MKIEKVSFVNPNDEWTIMVRSLYDRAVIIGPIHIQESLIKICYCGSATHIVEFDVSLKDNLPVVVTSDHDVFVNGTQITGRLVQQGENLDCTRSALRVTEYDRISHLYIWDILIEQERARILKSIAGKSYKDHLVFCKEPQTKSRKTDMSDDELHRRSWFFDC